MSRLIYGRWGLCFAGCVVTGIILNCYRKNRFTKWLEIFDYFHVQIQVGGGGGGGGQGVRTPLKNHKNKGFLNNAGPDPLKNHKATQPAFNIGPSLARQRNAIEMAFR